MPKTTWSIRFNFFRVYGDSDLPFSEVNGDKALLFSGGLVVIRLYFLPRVLAEKASLLLKCIGDDVLPGFTVFIGY